MKKRIIRSKGVSIIIFLLFLLACSTTTDINNEKAVMENIQGDWIGYVNVGSMYRHIKLNINKNSFTAWVKMSDYEDEPDWTELPDEKGLITLNSIQKDTERNLNFRKFVFYCPGRCCRDKSISIQALSELVTFIEGEGLTLDGNVKMISK